VPTTRELTECRDVLLLHEPTSSLDAQNEKTILETVLLSGKRRTVLIVTRRAAPLALVERVIRISHGLIREEPARQDVGIELLKPVSKSHVARVLRLLPKGTIGTEPPSISRRSRPKKSKNTQGFIEVESEQRGQRSRESVFRHTHPVRKPIQIQSERPASRDRLSRPSAPKHHVHDHQGRSRRVPERHARVPLPP